jgi:hypothetical protein
MIYLRKKREGGIVHGIANTKRRVKANLSPHKSEGGWREEGVVVLIKLRG